MMEDSHSLPHSLRKTRIVCISDTHNQTPKLPKGDVLIHAGDLTNQGSYAELEKTVDWLEKADFECKLVIAGNHDLTLDAAFYEEHGSRWKWPQPQNLELCRKLLKDSPSITYLENQAASFYLDSPNGPHTRFKVFGSPYSPARDKWAFQYQPEEASALWDAIPSDADIVVTHTPPKGCRDAATKDDRSGCEVLLQALHRIRPMMSVFGHIHEGRGVEIVQWNCDTPENGSLVERTEPWSDPGIGNNKQSMVDLSAKGGRRLNNAAAVPRCRDAFSLASDAPGHGGGLQRAETTEFLQPGAAESIPRNQGVADDEAEGRAVSGGLSQQCQAALQSDVGLRAVERGNARRETVMINAAVLGPRIGGRARHCNKPIVVDIDLPVWSR